MKISVVIPTYRRPALLARCLDALALQEFPSTDFEVIVVSDGSDPSTLEMINTVSVRNRTMALSFYQLPVKSGPATCRNTGWKKAAAELIAFTDDDCIPSPHWLSSIWEAGLQQGNGLHAFSGRTIVPIPSLPSDYELNISRLEQAEFITANCACSKNALILVGGFDEEFKMAWREDSDLQFKFITNGIAIHSLRNAIVTHPVREHEWAISIREQKKGVFNALLYKKFPELYRSRIGDKTRYNYYLIIFSLALMIYSAILGKGWLFRLSLTLWGTLTVDFAVRRLRNTSRSLPHVVEMLITSAAIPVLSLFYRWYGAVKYKVLFP